MACVCFQVQPAELQTVELFFFLLLSQGRQYIRERRILYGAWGLSINRALATVASYVNYIIRDLPFVQCKSMGMKKKKHFKNTAHVRYTETNPQSVGRNNHTPTCQTMLGY